MTLQSRSAPHVRRRLLTVILPLALALVFVSGCKHRRQAYRPVFSAPAVLQAPVAPPCPSGDCGGATFASPPAFSDSSVMTPPPAGPLGSEPISPPSNGGSGIGAGEPSFDPNLQNSSGDGVGRSVPTLEAPRSSFRPSPRAARRAVGGSRRDQLRHNLEAFTNDPGDLFAPPRADRPWRYVVLHHSAHPEGGLGQIDHEHRDQLGTNGCGYHFVIGNGTDSPDGRVEVAQRWAEQKPGAHCQDSVVPAANEYGVGICLVGDLDSAPPTPKQVQAARALVAYLQDRYEIPAENVRVHAGVAKTATSCPGRLFPADAILASFDPSFAAR